MEEVEMELREEVELQQRKVREFVMCKLYLPSFERKVPTVRIRLFKLPLSYQLIELKFRIAELYQKTYHTNLRGKKGVEVMFLDNEKDLIIFDTEEEWNQIKEVAIQNEVDCLKIRIEWDKFSPSKEPFIPKRTVVRPQPVSNYPPAQSQQYQPFVAQPQPMQIPQQPQHSSMLYPQQQQPQQPPPQQRLTQERIRKIQRKLFEMGFSDESKNLVLINRYGGDLNLVLSSGELHPSTN